MNAVEPLAYARAQLAAAIGKPAWGTALGTGSFLTVELGDAVTPPAVQGRPAARPHGAYHLWVYLAAWRIETPTEMVASSEDERAALATAVTLLDGLTLESIAIEPVSLSATFGFSGGVLLKTFSVQTSGGDHWLFYLPGGDVFTAGPGGAFSFGR